MGNSKKIIKTLRSVAKITRMKAMRDEKKYFHSDSRNSSETNPIMSCLILRWAQEKIRKAAKAPPINRLDRASMSSILVTMERAMMVNSEVNAIQAMRLPII
jgi:hypothetical protein